MNVIQVKSSWIKAYAKCKSKSEKENVLIIETLSTKTREGSFYAYLGVPGEAMEEFDKSDSKGKAYDRLIKGSFFEEKLDVKSWQEIRSMQKFSSFVTTKREKKSLALMDDLYQDHPFVARVFF